MFTSRWSQEGVFKSFRFMVRSCKNCSVRILWGGGDDTVTDCRFLLLVLTCFENLYTPGILRLTAQPPFLQVALVFFLCSLEDGIAHVFNEAPKMHSNHVRRACLLGGQQNLILGITIGLPYSDYPPLTMPLWEKHPLQAAFAWETWGTSACKLQQHKVFYWCRWLNCFHHSMEFCWFWWSIAFGLPVGYFVMAWSLLQPIFFHFPSLPVPPLCPSPVRISFPSCYN
jgi:hypothetical protein